jgi:CheY-like chemotaxis protein
VNNVLGVILNSATMLELETGMSEDNREDMSSIVEACKRGRDLTRNLLGFARKGKYIKTDISVNHIVKGAANLLSRTLSKDIHTKLALQPKLNHVEGDPGQLEHALMNLFINAADAMEAGGTIRVTSSNIAIPSPDEPPSLKIGPGSYIKLQVEDTGKGMDEATVQKAFEPFFTTKPEGKGTGLGLSMVYGTVISHRGDVVIHSAPGKGTAVTLYLPATDRRTSSKPVTPPWTRLVAADEGAQVLLVDDEPMILRSTKRILEKMEYQVLVAASGKEAIQLFKTNHRHISLVMLDMIMPEMDGTRIFTVLRQIDPNVKVAICSGYSKDSKVEKLIDQGAVAFIQKPFDLEVLAHTIKNIIRADPKPGTAD